MYTKGPWTIEHIKGLDLGASAEIMADKMVIAQVWKTDDSITRWSQDETGNANALLIAAAPTMDIAIRSMLININLALKSGNDGYLRLAIEGGEAAIAKIEKGE